MPEWLPAVLASLGPIIIAVFLAIYGWGLLKRIAGNRESYDLVASVVSTLEKLEHEVHSAWKETSVLGEYVLDEYEEQRLTTAIFLIELRLGILTKHYHSIHITPIQIGDLRHLVTAPVGSEAALFQSNEQRSQWTHQLLTTMTTSLLKDNYEFINSNR